MLENKLCITDSVELARTEEKISKQKAVEMFETGFLEKLESGTYESKVLSVFLDSELRCAKVPKQIASAFFTILIASSVKGI